MARKADDGALNIHQRIHGIMSEFNYVQKKKSGMPYKSVSHDDVTEKLQPLLQKYRVIVRPYVEEFVVHGNQSKVLMTVEWINIDTPADTFTSRTCGLGNDTQDKGPGKAMSYAFKYNVLKTLCIVTGDDPENESVPTTLEDDPRTTAGAGDTPRLQQPEKGGRAEPSAPAAPETADPPPAPATPRTLRPAERKSLWAALKQTTRTEPQIRLHMGALGVEHTEELTVPQAQELLAWAREEG